MKLDGKTAIITGGGRGIGRAIALRFAREGAAVLVSGSTQPAIDSVANEISDLGGRAIAVLADVADEAAVERMVSLAMTELGPVDILVNNAGITGPTAPVSKVSLADWERTMAVNLTGAFLCSRQVLPQMTERRSGRIINITSVAGTMGYPLRSPYAASKWGMIGFTRSLAEEVGPFNITVNAIAPGPVKGERMVGVITRRAAELSASYEAVEQEYLQAVALKRMVEEDDIAAMVLFLSSDEGCNITGETIKISGGHRL